MIDHILIEDCLFPSGNVQVVLEVLFNFNFTDIQRIFHKLVDNLGNSGDKIADLISKGLIHEFNKRISNNRMEFIVVDLERFINFTFSQNCQSVSLSIIEWLINLSFQMIYQSVICYFALKFLLHDSFDCSISNLEDTLLELSVEEADVNNIFSIFVFSCGDVSIGQVSAWELKVFERFVRV